MLMETFAQNNITLKWRGESLLSEIVHGQITEDKFHPEVTFNF